MNVFSLSIYTRHFLKGIYIYNTNTLMYKSLKTDSIFSIKKSIYYLHKLKEAC